MFFIPWSNDYETGVKEIDNQHKELFATINELGLHDPDTVLMFDLTVFLDALWRYAQKHFVVEERYMKEERYPLYERHCRIHANLKSQIEQVKAELMDSGMGYDSFKKVFDFAADWLNTHIREEDLSFFNYHKYSKPVIGRKYEGCECEISDINNILLGFGEISWVDSGNVTVSVKWDRLIDIPRDSTVKLMVITSKDDKDTLAAQDIWIGKVFISEKGTLRLTETKHVYIKQKREHYRLRCDIPATVGIHGTHSKVIAASISDIGVGGVLINCNQPFNVGDNFDIHFKIHDNELNLRCEVRRRIRVNFEHLYFGCLFLGASQQQEREMLEYIVAQQKATLK